MKEVICPACRKWNAVDLKKCTYCGSLLDSNEVRKKDREIKKASTGSVQTQPKWVENLISQAQNSKSPFVRLMLKSAVTIWMIYMTLVGFVLWSVAWLAG